MSLQELVEKLHKNFTPEILHDDGLLIMNYINNYVLENESKNNSVSITFGKYNGYLVSELMGIDKGRDYLQWLIGQSWIDKFPEIIKECSRLGIKPKIVNKNHLN